MTAQGRGRPGEERVAERARPTIVMPHKGDIDPRGPHAVDVAMTFPQLLRGECTVTLRLSPQCAAILGALLMRRGQAVSHETLIEAIWPNPDDEPATSHKQPYILLHRLMRGLPGLICNIHSRGWMIGLPMRRARR